MAPQITVESLILDKVTDLTAVTRSTNEVATATKVLVEEQGKRIESLDKATAGAVKDVAVLKNDARTLYRRMGHLESKKSSSSPPKSNTKPPPPWMTDRIKYLIYILAALASAAAGWGADKIPLP